MKRLLAAVFMLCSLGNFAQDIKEAGKPNPFTISGYVEAYYGYDFNKPADNNRPAFIYSHNRHNEFNLNLGFLRGSFNSERVRANLAFAAGTYINANYAAEPGVLKNIFEANTGIKISKKKNLWIDAGILPSHIGFESAVGKDCFTLTRSMLAENSPYYEAGAKITYTTDNNKWILSGLALNGWQRIKRVSGNSLMSFGTQVQYKPNTSIVFNYSTFIGTDKPDSARLMRYFHNIYGILSMGKLGIIAGLDLGQEQVARGSSDLNTWYSPVLILKYSLSGKWILAARIEYFQDADGVIIATGTVNGFKTTGFSLNLDYMPVNNAVVRLEAKSFTSKDDIFEKNGQLNTGNTAVTASIAVSF
nr:porin [Flavihumibacter fluvii]